MRGTAGEDATDLAGVDAKSGSKADAISDGDLPTRMLVFGVARHDGTILGSDVFSVAEACHRSPEQVRSCLRRLVGEGLFTREGEGREARYLATDAGVRAAGVPVD